MYYLSDLCFLCLVRSKNIKSVLSESEDNIIIEEKLECVLSELINFRPEIPKNICADCLKGLNYVYKFKQKCLENLMTLNEYLDKIAENGAAAHFLTIKTEDTATNCATNTKKSSETRKRVKKFICDICHRSFSQISHLKDHLLTHSNEKMFICMLCEYQCKRSTSLKRHMQIHSGNKHTCKYCQQAFSTTSYLNKHVRLKHNAEDKAKLSTEKQNSGVDAVIKVEADDLADNVQDEEEIKDCPKEFTFITTGYLNKHVIVKHNAENKVKVSTENQNSEADVVIKVEADDLADNEDVQDEEEIKDCPKDLTQCDYIDNTDQTSDDTKKPFSCPICDKKFRDRYNLQTHLRTHSGERPYQCTICLKAFTQSSVLKSHERIHTGIKPYNCEVCAKSFNDISTLIKHKRVHNNIRPYKCTMCDKRFKLSGHRTKHLVSVHGCVKEPFEIKY